MSIELILLIIILAIILLLFFILLNRKNNNYTQQFVELADHVSRVEEVFKRDLAQQREDNIRNERAAREELIRSIDRLRLELKDAFKANEQLFHGNMERFSAFQRERFDEMEKKQNSLLLATERKLDEMRDSLDNNMMRFTDFQRERFNELDKKQNSLILSTETKLEQMRETVDEKLQKTLNERISHSFELVSTQLENVQKGLGEMTALANDVGGLKRVLSNVKTRGVFGEIQLRALLDQMLSPEQFKENVITKSGSNDRVEFAILLPGKDEESGNSVMLPVDAKFPQDAYENLMNAQENGDSSALLAATRQFEGTILGMGKDIHDKYIDPPGTTDFAIMFLPFESIYAEVIRRTALTERLQKDFKVIVTGPTTLGAILNSLQMGFRTLAIQKRSGEVWKVLGAVKSEFGKFGGMLEKVKKNIDDAGTNLDKLVVTRTRMMMSKLRNIEELPMLEAQQVLQSLPEEDEEI